MINVSYFPLALYEWDGTLSLPVVLPALSAASPVMTSNAHPACQDTSCTFLLKESDAERKALFSLAISNILGSMAPVYSQSTATHSIDSPSASPQLPIAWPVTPIAIQIAQYAALATIMSTTLV